MLLVQLVPLAPLALSALPVLLVPRVPPVLLVQRVPLVPPALSALPVPLVQRVPLAPPVLPVLLVQLVPLVPRRQSFMRNISDSFSAGFAELLLVVLYVLCNTAVLVCIIKFDLDTLIFMDIDCIDKLHQQATG